MCLQLTNSQKKVAVEDITVYKAVQETHFLTDYNINGKEFTGIIKGHKVEGHIYASRIIFLCTDEVLCDGARCSEKFGHSYSWLMDENVSSIIIDGVEKVEPGMTTPFQNFRVKIGETHTSELKEEDNEIYEGFHSMVTLKDTKELFPYGYLYIECVIPAGSEYYEGTYDSLPSIASNAIYFKELIS